mmetsp:Transcript_22595/g.57682  ORF Transcript_22595/g.57682 Transcript_22595/m.57682 type:complete len:299 (+) Transcript_22595:368-1264(+)
MLLPEFRPRSDLVSVHTTRSNICVGEGLLGHPVHHIRVAVRHKARKPPKMHHRRQHKIFHHTPVRHIPSSVRQHTHHQNQLVLHELHPVDLHLASNPQVPEVVPQRANQGGAVLYGLQGELIVDRPFVALDEVIVGGGTPGLLWDIPCCGDLPIGECGLEVARRPWQRRQANPTHRPRGALAHCGDDRTVSLVFMPTHKPVLRVLHHTAIPIPIKHPAETLLEVLRRVAHVQAIPEQVGELEAQKIVDTEAKCGGNRLPRPGDAGGGAVDAGDGVAGEREGAAVLIDRIRPGAVLRRP